MGLRSGEGQCCGAKKTFTIGQMPCSNFSSPEERSDDQLCFLAFVGKSSKGIGCCFDEQTKTLMKGVGQRSRPSDGDLSRASDQIFSPFKNVLVEILSNRDVKKTHTRTSLENPAIKAVSRQE